MRGLTGFTIAGAAVLAFTGCGGSTTTVVTDRTVTQTATQGSTTTTSTQATATTPTTSQPPTSFIHAGSFQSPSGNIGCALIAGIARCDIVKRNWRPPPRPASCPSEVDFGQGIEMSRSGPARFVCAGDTARATASPRLAYGTASQVGTFICVSRTSGMTCTNRRDGHGFFISIQSYRLF